MIYQSEKTLEELGDKVTETEKAPIQAAIEKLREALKGSDVEAIKTATDEVQKAFYAISEKLYQQQAAEGTANGANADAAGSAPNDDGVVDADYEVVDDDQ